MVTTLVKALANCGTLGSPASTLSHISGMFHGPSPNASELQNNAAASCTEGRKSRSPYQPVAVVVLHHLHQN